jgi:hypothetical protein
MRIGITAVYATFAVTIGASAFAQRIPDPAFTATGQRCSDVTWSEEALARYPNIASACRDVLERDGRYYVRFEGEVRRVEQQGQRVTIDFVEGDTLTLTPPENMTLTIDGRMRSARDLRPGDDLTFYVPEHQLTAAFFAGEPQTSEPQEVPISPPEEAPRDVLAQAEPEPQQPAQPRTLPRTAGPLPLAGAAGLAMLGLGGLLTAVRRLRARR